MYTGEHQEKRMIWIVQGIGGSRAVGQAPCERVLPIS